MFLLGRSDPVSLERHNVGGYIELHGTDLDYLFLGVGFGVSGLDGLHHARCEAPFPDLLDLNYYLSYFFGWGSGLFLKMAFSLCVPQHHMQLTHVSGLSVVLVACCWP